MDLQEILVYIILIVALAFLYQKFFGKKNDKNCGNDDCGCH